MARCRASGGRHVVVLVVAVGNPRDGHLAGQLAGRVCPHAVGHHEQMSRPLPSLHVAGQHDGVGVLICRPPQADIADFGVLQAVFPVHNRSQVFLVQRQKVSSVV